MPLYTYEHPETEELVDIVQSMKEDHVYIDSEGVKWNRVFYAPEASTDSSIDPFDREAFKSKTFNKKGSYNDVLQKSKELGQMRKDKLGYDPVQKKYFKDYSSKRRGIKHPLDNT
jgi:hypothetical protein